MDMSEEIYGASTSDDSNDAAEVEDVSRGETVQDNVGHGCGLNDALSSVDCILISLQASSLAVVEGEKGIGLLRRQSATYL